jgi:hypothetical protein
VTVDLEGSWARNGVDWELRVSGHVDGRTFDHDLWYRGHSAFDGRTGYWIFSDLDDEGADVARLDWSDPRTGPSELELEVIDPADPDYGDHVAYLDDGPVRRVEWTDTSANLVSFVTWDEATGAGSLRVPDYNGGERACWDEDQEDAACPGGGVDS